MTWAWAWAWHGMGCFHTLTFSHPHSLAHTHTHTHTSLSPPFSPRLRRSQVASLLFCFLPCLVLPSPAPHFLLASQPLPLELVGDFPPTISCPRAGPAQPVACGSPPASLGSAPCHCSLHSILTADHILAQHSWLLGGKYHHSATLIHQGQLFDYSGRTRGRQAKACSEAWKRGGQGCKRGSLPRSDPLLSEANM